jgi:outer membrane lipoprotein LolB
MNRFRALAAALGLLLIAACASVSPGARDAAAPFDIVGRVLVSGEGRAFSSNLRWRHGGGSDELWLMSPVGQTLAHIRADGNGATLTTADQQEYQAFSAEGLTRRALGWALPLDGLRHWVRAKPAPGGEIATLNRDAQGRVERIEQGGWVIRYDYGDARPSPPLPRRLDLASGGQRIRLVIDAWRSGEAQ